MTAKLLDGKSLSEQLKKETSAQAKLLKTYGINPCLAVCLVGEDKASQVYVNRKQKACEEVGIKTISECLPSNSSTSTLTDKITAWNKDTSIHGILVQLPLPSQIDRFTILNTISPQKDVDGFHPVNIGKIVHAKPSLIPCTPLAIQYILNMYEIALNGKTVVIVNDTIVVGRPLVHMLLDRGATVSVCHSRTKNLTAYTSAADIVIVAVGKRPNFHLSPDMVKPGVVVIDVGINRLDNRIVGDADPEIANVASWLTPCPGGVGPLTIAFLLKNTTYCASMQHTFVK